MCYSSHITRRFSNSLHLGKNTDDRRVDCLKCGAGEGGFELEAVEHKPNNEPILLY